MKSDPNSQRDLFAGDLYGEMYQAEQDAAPARLPFTANIPGLLTCLIAALAALWLSEHYGFPAVLLGLIIGLALNFLSEHPALGAGLDFAARHFLRVGIVLLGLQVTWGEIGGMGWTPFLGLFAIMAAAFAAGLAGSAAVGQGRYAGTLAGGATAICGASAALALYGVIGKNRLDASRFTITLVGVALASAVALTTYPLIAAALDLTDGQAGYLVGSSIHDVAQAIGGGYAISDAAGDQATIVKLARVAMLAPVVALVALWLGDPGEQGASRPMWCRLTLPWFITAFLLLMAVNSFVDLPESLATRGLDLAKFLLLLAVTATAMRSKLALLLEAGWKPLVPVFTATIASFVTALAVTLVMID